MSSRLHIKINSSPRPSPRPRVTEKHTYLPIWYRDHKKLVQAHLVDAKMIQSTSLGVKVRITLSFIPAKSVKNNKYKVPKGGVDDYAKTYLDAMNGIVFEDDAMVSELTVIKKYSDENSIDIIVWEQ